MIKKHILKYREAREEETCRDDKITFSIIGIVISIIIVPMIILQGDYIYTIHDYLDSWPSLFSVLKRDGIFYSLDGEMSIAQGMSPIYLYFSFDAYRFLNFLFDFVRAEIVNKTLGIFIGLYTMQRLLKTIFQKEFSRYKRLFYLIALAYAITPVYPNWTISFACLPLIVERFYTYIKNPSDKPKLTILFYLLYGFFIYFPAIGIFGLGIWVIGIVINLICNKVLNKRMVISFIIMTISSILCNLNIFIYSFGGQGTNRDLVSDDMTLGESVFTFIEQTGRSLLIGQYHADPLSILISIVCITLTIIMIKTAWKDYRINKNVSKNVIVVIFIWGIMTVLSMVYGADSAGWISALAKKILPFLGGFNFGRIQYFNNVLRYVLLCKLLVSFIKSDKKRVLSEALIVIQLCLILFTSGSYQDTVKNLLYFGHVERDEVTFNEFFDVNFFEGIKEDIQYNNEGVVSIGYHPAVAMYNGFNTLDGYLCINPIEYHNKFREIIAPTLDVNEEIRDYYDGWGGRIYVFVDSKNVVTTRDKTVYEKEILINIAAFKEMGGQYLLSKYKIVNADELGLELVAEHDSSDGIYHVLVYEAK